MSDSSEDTPYKRKYQPVIFIKKGTDRTGQRFGRLTAIRPIGSTKKGIYYLCLCDCGNHKEASSANLKSGKIASCGCLKNYHAAKHLASGTVEYDTWAGIKNRVFNVKSHAYKDYGGRGIGMADSWAADFCNFLDDVGYRPSSNHSLDRINNNGNYEPGNCRWATKLEQANNKRNVIPVTINGITLTAAQWSRHFGISRQTFVRRLETGESFALKRKRGKKC